MTEAVTSELIYEVLKDIRNDVSHMKEDIRDLKEGQIAIREDLQSLRRDGLRQERAIAAVQLDIERINKRLGLKDATH